MSVESTAAHVVPSVTTVKPGQEYRLVLTLTRGHEAGRIQGEITVRTNHPVEKTVTVPLYGLVIDPRQAYR